jgi:hypothetical protein
VNGTPPASGNQPAASAPPLLRATVGRLLADRPGPYALLLLVAAFAAASYSLRVNGIFSCQATGYGRDRYLSYCQATSYGDYDHGAIWYDLEPVVDDAATGADVLFLGNSRMQLGLSTRATADWFAGLRSSYYLLGFSHNGNYNFEAPLVRKLHPRARVYVINLDLFFEPIQTGPAATVMGDRGARARYEQKRLWQRVHRPICATLPFACRDEHAFFRSRATGAWIVQGGAVKPAPVKYDESVDTAAVSAYATAGAVFLAQLPADSACIVLTIIPTTLMTPHTAIGTARAVAGALGRPLVAPTPDGLFTFDQSHLDQPSAERWSAAFFEAAGPQIQRCLAAGPGGAAATGASQ